VEASLRRIDELQPTINAFTQVAHEPALAAADSIRPGDGRPFAGVPIAIKDNRAVTGMPTTMCSDLFGDPVAGYDAYSVRRLREAGFVIVGKTTLPEMGIPPTTEPRRFGATHNPWDLSRTPGGSSGGSAAAVAAGNGPDRARQRRRRINPHPGRLLRARRPQAGQRPSLAGPGLRSELPGEC
jgi:amidase